MDLAGVVPWGRTADEYERMFALSRATDLRRRVVGVADGPASFNAEWTAAGGAVTSVDPLYAAPAAAIAARYAAARAEVLAAVAANRGAYVWGTAPGQLRDVAHLADRRDAAMAAFAADLRAGRAAGRYVAGGLPALPLPADAADVALVSHYLFLYSGRPLDEAAHVAAVDELLRVAPEARIFPLLTLGGEPSPHLDAVVGHAERRGWAVRVERVAYEAAPFTCRVCKATVAAGANGPAACARHPGPWLGAENGKLAGTGPADPRLVRGVSYFWDCCGGGRDAAPCAAGWHEPYQ